MKRITIRLSTDILEVAATLAGEMGITCNELISSCLEGSTYLAQVSTRDMKHFLCAKGSTNPQ